jgi:ABC-type amino acid transport substrate-binding protein
MKKSTNLPGILLLLAQSVGRALPALAGLGLGMLLTACGERRELVIGMDATYPPFEFVNDEGRMDGVSVEIGRAIAERLGKPVEFRNLAFDGLLPALQSGRLDLIISSMTANEKRRQSIDFSEPYVATGLAVLTGLQSPVKAAADLRAQGRRIAVRIGTSGEQWCRQELPKAVLTSLDTDAACVMEVIRGTCDAWIYDQISVMNYHTRHAQQTRALLEPLQREQWAVGLAKGRPELLQSVNETLRQMRADGRFDQLAKRFLAKESAQMKQAGLPFVFEIEPGAQPR